MGIWINTQQQNYKNKLKIMKDITIYNEWTNFVEQHKEYLFRDDIWNELYEKANQFILNNNRRPSYYASDEEEKKLATWILNQQKKYKTRSQCMRDQNRYNMWTAFINNNKKYFLNDKEYWHNMHNKLDKFFLENNKRPKYYSENKDEKILSTWMNTQSQKYKTKSAIMKNFDIFNEWTQFIEKYKKYFIDIDQEI